MSHILDYRRKLDDLRLRGQHNEGAVSFAFARLLDSVGESHHLAFSSQYGINLPNGAKIIVDGVLTDRLGLVHGYWEAKDSKDDLDKEIKAKIVKGYPTDNIIFEDTLNAVLYQDDAPVLRIDLADDAALQHLLDRFFAYLPRAVQDFHEAKAKFLANLPGVAGELRKLMAVARRDNPDFREQATAFLAMCQRAIGERFDAAHVDEMLVQHILTDSIFRAIFPNARFHEENHIARAVTALELTFLRNDTRANFLKRMEPYFGAIHRAAQNAATHAEKQSFLKAVYEDFYTAYNPKDADRLGVVYTPHEAVRFIIEGCDWLARNHFNRGLASPDLDILDPCMGTGTFIVDLVDYLRGDKLALARKFKADEVHANEIAILPYYIACLNIEQSLYDGLGHWVGFRGACFVNTLENWGFEQGRRGQTDDLFGALTDVNHERIVSQNARKIPVIFGNPPYNANQQNENDNNKNEIPKKAESRVRETYIKASTAQKTKLYDPYVCFIRWASDRIGEEGMVALITNRSYLDSRQADGLRKSLTVEFQRIWVVDLMSDVRKNPKISGTKYNIFGIQAGVAIIFLVRDPKLEGCDIRYMALDDFLPAEDKRRWLAAHTLERLARNGELTRIEPNARGDWLNQPEHDWSSWLPVASKDGKVGKTDEVIFRLFASSIKTNRDEWVYDFSKSVLSRKARYLIDAFNRQLEKGTTDDEDLDYSIKWSSTLKTRRSKLVHNSKLAVISVWRPFVRKFYYAEKALSDRLTGLHYQIHGNKLSSQSLMMCISGGSAMKPFQTLVISGPSDYECVEKNQLLPSWVYVNDQRHDNITDWALRQFQDRYADETVTRRDIFDYVYAVLHDPDYREKYALNLKAEFPRIPFYPDFHQWAAWGRRLVALHIDYAKLKGYPLERRDNLPRVRAEQSALSTFETGRNPQETLNLTQETPRCRLKSRPAEGIIEIDAITTLHGIPPEAWAYRLGNRSALDWVLEEYREKTPKDPTIRERFNTYRFADHKESVIQLLGQVCEVSVETAAILKAMRSASKNL